MQDEREVTIELERERRGTDTAPIRLAPDDLEPDTLRSLVESFVLREGTDYGLHETSLEDKVAQVLIQLRRGDAQITFDPATESVNVVVTSGIGGSGIDPVWWTSSERWIRCPDRWQSPPRAGVRADDSMTNSKHRRSGWSSTRARPSEPLPAISI